MDDVFDEGGALSDALRIAKPWDLSTVVKGERIERGNKKESGGGIKEAKSCCFGSRTFVIRHSGAAFYLNQPKVINQEPEPPYSS